ncbi:WLM-domain-containing protein [Laetiporus sulphureus 93-53]|uniref:WLM-domain-containing protein n=1 Tax=Laetiporus sulphureus 93-53 TaxID=1314785 RepID=A0A165EUU0_9APHY|nr:WLM-domain-containing protein [Laetiporus sulphureus 93-53]KZT07806.1 WLM-domain-containing protein [Laetiporus sulphureus 93-53]
MVHVRLNAHETNPNQHVNFITALPHPDTAAHEAARQLLRALAAQVRPVMKAHGFVVNSLEEYEHNRVFAGRNWNNGEVVELVLRGASGSFQPVSWLMNTLCHELAHIAHMNHGRDFQALWAKLRNEVRELQMKGYYGDGYWSSGTRLADSARVGEQSFGADELPEYMCGGAQKRTRPTARRRRIHTRTQPAGPSTHTGVQTAKQRKAGARVTTQGAFGSGPGKTLNDDVSDEERKKAGAGFRKKAGSKRARQERAEAAERRLRALQGQASSSVPSGSNNPPPSDDESSDTELLPETDQDRRRAMIDTAEGADELEGLRSSRADVWADFFVRAASSSSLKQRTAVPDAGCDVQKVGAAGGTGAISSGSGSGSTKKVKRMGREEDQPMLEDWLPSAALPSGSSSTGKKPRQTGKSAIPYGSLVEDEVKLRKRESFGLTGWGQRLGDGSELASTRLSALARGCKPNAADASEGANATLNSTSAQSRSPSPSEEWTCLMCTLRNEPGHLACSACATPRGEWSWAENLT